MAKRFLVSSLAAGLVHLDETQSHHARDVMRLASGDVVEVFDVGGRSATGPIVSLMPVVAVSISEVSEGTPVPRIVVASAVPKGNRADWMIEKLSEIGVARFVPLQTTRSVVHPEGKGKLQRWERLAAESAKQSHRTGTMEIAELTALPLLLRELGSQPGTGWFLSTRQPAQTLADAAGQLDPARPVYLLIGPEGGWTDQEEELVRGAGWTAVSLTVSILRIETAALVAAGTAASWLR